MLFFYLSFNVKNSNPFTFVSYLFIGFSWIQTLPPFTLVILPPLEIGCSISVIVGGCVAFVPWFSDWRARLANCRWPGLLDSTLSRNGFMPLTGDRPRRWRIRRRAEYSCSCSPATKLLQDIHVRGTLLPDVCSPLLVLVEAHPPNTGLPVSGVG